MKSFPTCIPARLARLSIITAALGTNFAATAADAETIVVSATRFAAPIDQLPIGIRIITAADAVSDHRPVAVELTLPPVHQSTNPPVQ